MQIDDAALANSGGRQTVANLWAYWAHLSIYRFALPFAEGRHVLDAGSGAGYGAAYLAQHGAQVVALDVSVDAIELSRRLYASDKLTFDQADLNAPLPFATATFDLVFSSNVFEHVANVDGLAAECARVAKPDGVAIVAVPPICFPAAMAGDIENQFHVHHIPPTAWDAKLRRYFVDVRCHRHVGCGEFAANERMLEELKLAPDLVAIRETDFVFPEIAAAAMQASGDSITAVFVCRGRRDPIGEETLAERTPAVWCEGDVVARLLRRMHAELAEAKAAAADRRGAPLAAGVAAIERPLRGRLARPLRAIAAVLRGR